MGEAMTTYETALQAIQDAPMSLAISASPWLFPTLETLHVIALALVVGAIANLDLRLLGLAWRRTPVDRLARGLLPLTWGAFGAAVGTGGLMFVSNAATYGVNRAFQIKLALIALAGVNMILFHLTSYRTVGSWGAGGSPPDLARLAGAVSLSLWVAIVALGRWIGFTL